MELQMCVCIWTFWCFVVVHGGVLYNHQSHNVIHMDQGSRQQLYNSRDLPVSSAENSKAIVSSHEQFIYSGNDVRAMLTYSAKTLNLELDREQGVGGFWNTVECNTCKLVVLTIQKLFAVNRSEDEIASILTKICIDLAIEDKPVCIGAVKIYKAEVLTVVDEVALSPDELCGHLFGEDCATSYDPFEFWNITLPNIPKPPVTPLKLPKPSMPKMRILHLTDIHVDESYVPNTNAECGEPVCCRKANGPPNGTVGAGFWGDYRSCDFPMWTLENLFHHLSVNQSYDVIYWTGDLPGHEVWLQTREEVLSLLESISSLFKKYFPHTPIFSTLGNHEGVPVNAFPPPVVTDNNSVSWLYDALVKQWDLPSSTHYDLSRGGYYSLLIKPGLRLISLNTNYCNKENWWLLLNMTDPTDHLSWLAQTLQAAEDNHEKVHIIGHIPPGHSSCMKPWSWNYYRIVNRYESTIAGQFFGHTHQDSFEVFYDLDTNLTRPVSVAYISPSVTTFLKTNPGYRVFVADGNYNGSTWQILDHETYVMNLTEANLTNKTNWSFVYSAKDKYGMKSLFPADWNALIYKMNTTDSLMQMFYKFYYKLHPPGPFCNAGCKSYMLCELKSARSNDPDLCNDLHGQSPEEFHQSYLRWAKKVQQC